MENNLQQVIQSIREIYGEAIPKEYTDIEILYAFAASSTAHRLENETLEAYKERRRLKNIVDKELVKGYRI